MKRILVLLLCLTMLLSTVACSQLALETLPVSTETFGKSEESGTKTEEVKETGPIVLPKGFSAGFSRIVINPDNRVAMGGYPDADSRISTKQVDDITVTCTALSDGENVFLLYCLDYLYVRDDILNSVSKRVSKYLDGIEVPPENFILNATHTHSAPILHYPDMTGMGRYMVKFYPAFYQVTEEAVRDLELCTLYGGETHTEHQNFVRRYVYKNGSYAGGTGMGAGQDPNNVFHETEADSQLQILRFDRTVGKDIILCNWQCHVCSAGLGGQSNTGLSADWVGTFRKAVEKNLDVHFSYHQGAAGNLAGRSLITGEKCTTDYKKKGEELAVWVEKALENQTVLQTGTFRAVRTEVIGTLKPGDNKKNNFYVSALSIGDVGFAVNPCEMHDTNGMQVKEGSPFKMTFMCAYSNDIVGYIASAAAFDNGGYEVEMCRFVKGTGEKIVGELLKLLDELHKAY